MDNIRFNRFKKVLSFTIPAKAVLLYFMLYGLDKVDIVNVVTALTYSVALSLMFWPAYFYLEKRM